MFHNNKRGYTLVEILAGVLIVSIVTVGGFYAINAVSIGNVKLINKTNIEQQAFYFSERFFELIKSSGTLDYEEYFNRKNVGNTTYLSGHYSLPTRFGNGETDYIYCISKSGNDKVTSGSGCIDDYNIFGSQTVGAVHQDYTGDVLLYGQYQQQFIDYNSDADGNLGDEDTIPDGSIIGDADDLFFGNGPEAFGQTGSVSEIYLVNSTGDQRTFFRWFVKEDDYPNKPASATCDFTDHQNPTGSGCLGTVQFLKLRGVDWGHDHDISITDVDGTQNDGKVDTWIYDPDIYGLAFSINAEKNDTVADIPSLDSENYWLPIFADGIHVKKWNVFAYPNKDPESSWGDSTSVFLSPYLRVSMTLTPSWSQRIKMQGKVPEVDIRTTINLTNYYN